MLGNAFKFTVRGSVSLGARRAGRGVVHFEVADTGIGVAADQQTAIFEPFRQVASPRSPDQSGIGLGLHICARLIGLMGGDLCVESAPERGSRFFFELALPALGDGAQRSATAEGPPPDADARTAVPAAFALPSPEEIDALLTLSLEGDIVRLRARLRELAGADASLGEFTRAVDALAAGFRMEAIGEYPTRIRPRGE